MSPPLNLQTPWWELRTGWCPDWLFSRSLNKWRRHRSVVKDHKECSSGWEVKNCRASSSSFGSGVAVLRLLGIGSGSTQNFFVRGTQVWVTMPDEKIEMEAYHFLFLSSFFFANPPISPTSIFEFFPNEIFEFDGVLSWINYINSHFCLIYNFLKINHVYQNEVDWV